MSELTTFEWSLERVVWFLNFLNSIFSSVTGWSAKYADNDVHEDLKALATDIEDSRQFLSNVIKEDANEGDRE